MIHYSCDLCKRNLDAGEPRYVVQIEVAQAFEPLSLAEDDDDRDYLEEVSELLEGLSEDTATATGDGVCQKMRFDLCPECHQKFVKHPLGRDAAKQLDFSQN